MYSRVVQVPFFPVEQATKSLADDLEKKPIWIPALNNVKGYQ